MTNLKINTIILCIALLSIATTILKAQENDSELLRNLLVEISAQNDDESIDLEQQMEMLEDLAENPVHINSATFEDLSRIAWLTEFQINSLLDHVKKKGPIVSYYEIAYLYGFTPELAQTLVPFISLEKPPETVKPKRALLYGKHKVLTGIQTVLNEQKGYYLPDSVSNRYLGNPFKTYFKYSFSYSDRLYFGINGEKDAGEEFFHGKNRKGFDFYSAHFQLNTDRFIKTLVLGDFRADFGQGLVAWSGFGYGKSAMILNAMRYNGGLRKYSSMDENSFLRGAGTTIRFKPMDISIFYSHKAIDATVSVFDSTGHPLQVSTLANSGYHRTANESEQKDAVTEQKIGANISTGQTNWHVGATFIYSQYNAEIVPKSNIYNYFAFSGYENANLSIDFRFRLGDVIFYGEQAASQNKALAMLYGAQMLIGEHLCANVLYRRYDKKYHAMLGHAFGENSSNNNEEGFFIGWSWDTGSHWRFSSYFDWFRFPWLRYRTDAPSFGRDILLQADYAPSRETKLYIQAKYKEKEENLSEPTIRATTNVQTATIKLVFSHQIIEGIGIGNHLEVKNYQKENTSSNGYFLAQDAYATINTFKRFPLRITLRYALFDTNDYNSRIYSFENDMLYAFSVPAFYDQGMRLYLILRYSLGKHIDLRAKYAITHYTNRSVISSGLNEIQGNKYSEIKLQLSCKF